MVYNSEEYVKYVKELNKIADTARYSFGPDAEIVMTQELYATLKQKVTVPDHFPLMYSLGFTVALGVPVIIEENPIGWYVRNRVTKQIIELGEL